MTHHFRKFPKISSSTKEAEYEKTFNQSYTVYELLQQKMEGRTSDGALELMFTF